MNTNQIDVENILLLEGPSVLLVEERERKDVVIGAPHHSNGGVKYLPCTEHPDADENTGFIARGIAESIKASSIVACNYRVDPNKNLGTDYSMQIAKWSPKYLVEIHGHGAKKVAKNVIEISSGTSARNNFSKSFALALQRNFTTRQLLKDYIVNGDFNSLNFKGTKSATITDERWIPLQIELPPLLRINSTDNKLPFFVADLIDCLVKSIDEICE